MPENHIVRLSLKGTTKIPELIIFAAYRTVSSHCLLKNNFLLQNRFLVRERVNKKMISLGSNACIRSKTYPPTHPPGGYKYLRQSV